MNTSKQINVMIGLLFVLFVVTGGYLLNESNRQEEETEEITERNAERGARLFVRNCRGCHGLDGEGGIGPRLNNPAFLILGDGNVFNVDETPKGEVANIQSFLRETISCGRAGTFMPKWAIDFGGSLSNTQVDQLVQLIANDPTGKIDFWELVVSEGEEADEEQFAIVLEQRFAIVAVLTERLGREPTDQEVEAFEESELPEGAERGEFIEEYGREPTTAEIREESEAVTPADASTLSITQNTCGQYTNDLKLERRSREDPRVAAPPTATPGDGTGTPTATATAADPAAVGQQLATTLGCLGCHTIDGSPLVGPSWLGLFGRTKQLDDGSTVVVDEAYLRESILNPNAKVVEGFPGGIMPAFESLSDDQLEALIAYIQTLEE